jgi:hypothetical protein
VLIGFVEIKVLATRIIIGPEGSLAKVNSFGYANLVVMLTNAISIAIFASKFMLTMERMLILMGKSGLNAISARNGFTRCVKSKMATKTYPNYWHKTIVPAFSIYAMGVGLTANLVVKVS